MAQRLGLGDPSWQTSVEPDTGRVLVRLVVLDQEAARRIGDDAGKVVLEPLVHKG